MDEISQEVKDDIKDGSFSLKDIDALETHLLNQLLQHCGAKNRGICATSKATQLDGRLTAPKARDALVNLYQHTGICAFMIFSWGNAADPMLPYCVDSNDALNFFLQVFNHNSFELMHKFKQWFWTQDEGPKKRNNLAGACSEVSHMFLNGLCYITNKPTVKTEYINYDFAVCNIYGVQLVGLPSDIELLHEGPIFWVKMTKPEHKALIAKHNTLCVELPSGSLKQCTMCLDKGKVHKKTAEKEGMGSDPRGLAPHHNRHTPTVSHYGHAVDPNMAFGMPIDPTVLNELLRLPPLFNIPEGLPTAITDDLSILPCSDLLLPTSLLQCPILTGSSLHHNWDDDGSSSGAPRWCSTCKEGLQSALG
ncbi:hypothetical protein DFH08DRAFT_814396 [Mycena albidolilacea]|uniref:Uncharacterized protein n=1 Tax=Mycena albidolilacea TaxID=1033008 RepID=A0AAD6ZP73_9AGAR|nr:hypothetical protein DFH08DRAFT_814396 [Mycena albidolilacea]